MFVVNLLLLEKLCSGHEGAVASMAVSKDASQLVSCGAADKTLKVFDLASGMLVCNKELHQGLRYVLSAMSICFQTILDRCWFF